jgi:hypothetical protein
MPAIVPVRIDTAGGSRAWAARAHAIQKTSASSALGRENADAHGAQEETASSNGVERLCRDDTSTFDPFWDGPRLVPAFVAQLLGQVMPERRETVMVETAYGRAVLPRKALLLDRKS